MAFKPDDPFPKIAGNIIRSEDWNELVGEVQGLDKAKVNRAGDTMSGPLSVSLPGSSAPVAALTIDVDSFGTAANAELSYFLRIRDVYSGTTAFYFRGDGNLGIGTDKPKGRLHLGPSKPSLLLVGNTEKDEDGLRIHYNEEIKWGVIDVKGTRLHFRGEATATGGGATFRMSIDLTTGDLGIGTPEPDARLEVVAPGAVKLTGDARSQALVTSAGTLGAYFDNELALASIGFHSDDSVSLGIRAMRVSPPGDQPDDRDDPGAPNIRDWTATAIGLGMDVGNTARRGASLWLHANGHVGIGTTTPQATLDVGGEIRANTLRVSGDVEIKNAGNLFLTAAAEDPGDIIFQTSSGSQKGRIWTEPSTKKRLYFSSEGIDPALSIDENGNLGIRTTDPKASLHIGGAHPVSPLIIEYPQANTVGASKARQIAIYDYLNSAPNGTVCFGGMIAGWGLTFFSKLNNTRWVHSINPVPWPDPYQI